MAAESPPSQPEHLAQAETQPEQAPAPEEDLLTQGTRLFFERLRSQQQEHESAREQGLGL